MITFKDFALGEKDIIFEDVGSGDLKLHLSHLEDLAIENGKKGFKQFDQQVMNLLNYVRNLNSDVKVSDKIDGAPALYFGVDPRLHYKGQFFVSIKGGFNKQPKICHSKQEIQHFYKQSNPAIIPILTSALKNLSKVYDGSGLMYHGDLLFDSKNDKKIVVIEGTKYVTFTPNTITYAVPVDENSEIYKRVINAELGIIIHAGYYAETDSENTRIIPRIAKREDFEQLIQNGILKNVFVEDSTLHKPINLDVSIDNIQKIKAYLSKSWGYINNISDRFDNDWKSNPSLDLLKIFINSQVKSRSGGIFNTARSSEEFNFDKFADEFRAYIRERYEKEAETRKTATGKASRISKGEQIVDWVNEHIVSFEYLISAMYLMLKIKREFLKIFDQIEGKVGRTFIKNPDGTYDISKGEGFVLSIGTNQVKLVDRLDFSRKNMLQGAFK